MSCLTGASRSSTSARMLRASPGETCYRVTSIRVSRCRAVVSAAPVSSIQGKTLVKRFMVTDCNTTDRLCSNRVLYRLECQKDFTSCHFQTFEISVISNRVVCPDHFAVSGVPDAI